MLLQYTNETAIYLSLILVPHKSFVQPANDTLCNILWQNNSQVRSSSYLVSGVCSQKWEFSKLWNMDLPSLLKQRIDLLIDFLVEEFKLQTEQLKHWYCFVGCAWKSVSFLTVYSCTLSCSIQLQRYITSIIVGSNGPLQTRQMRS